MSLSRKSIRARHDGEDRMHMNALHELERERWLLELKLLRNEYDGNMTEIERLQAKTQCYLDMLEILREEEEKLLRDKELNKGEVAQEIEKAPVGEEEDEDFTEQLSCLKDYAEEAIKLCYNVTEHYVDGKSLHLKIVYPDGLYKSVITFRNNGCYSYSTTKIQDSTTGSIARGIQDMLFGGHDISRREERIQIDREHDNTVHTEVCE